MKALWRNKLYAVRDTLSDHIELDAFDSNGLLAVPLADKDLIIDPTTDEIELAEHLLSLGITTQDPD